MGFKIKKRHQLINKRKLKKMRCQFLLTHPLVKITLIKKKHIKLKLPKDETLTDRFLDPKAT